MHIITENQGEVPKPERGYIMFKKEEKNFSVLRTVLIIAGIVVVLMTAMVVLYKVFKKYFRVTLECGDCDICDGDCFCEDGDFEPECCVYDGAADIADDIADEIADSFDAE